MPETTTAIPLTHRAVIALSGPDARTFLDGLVTNAVADAGPDRAIYAALLTPQGKYLFDLFIVEAADGRLLLDAEAERKVDLVRRLTMYKLRADVTIEDLSDTMAVWAVLSDTDAASAEVPGQAINWKGGVRFRDPRHVGLGHRALLPVDADPGLAVGALEDYDARRVPLGITDGGRDVLLEKTLILEANLDSLNGVSFTKGCYVGQELTARMKHRGKVRKRFLPVSFEGGVPDAGTPVTRDGREVGLIRTGQGDHAIALLHMDDVDGGAALTAGGRPLTPALPDWLVR